MPACARPRAALACSHLRTDLPAGEQYPEALQAKCTAEPLCLCCSTGSLRARLQTKPMPDWLLVISGYLLPVEVLEYRGLVDMHSPKPGPLISCERMTLLETCKEVLLMLRTAELHMRGGQGCSLRKRRRLMASSSVLTAHTEVPHARSASSFTWRTMSQGSTNSTCMRDTIPSSLLRSNGAGHSGLMCWHNRFFA